HDLYLLHVYYTFAVRCQNGGECISVNGIVTCLCASGWTGLRCQEAVCPQGCQSDGACVASGICSCQAGGVGGDCNLAVCKLLCQHGGKCIAPNMCHTLVVQRKERNETSSAEEV
ncbi:PREDICTED: wnt inhibitory factor 1-like, partial [Crocodylus porosus]|uniref:wnt inhibitory factor 1-like n=1 Tax=Crocodylus porosus TaxID=8502 RepID=UPI00093E2C7E